MYSKVIPILVSVDVKSDAFLCTLYKHVVCLNFLYELRFE